MRKVDPAKHRARREHILRAAAELFATRGFKGATIAELCKATGMSSGNLFHYFASKREIFIALVVDGDGGTDEQLAVALAHDDPWEGLVGFVDHLVTPAAEPVVPGLVLEAMLQAHRDPALAERLGADAENEEAGLVALLERAARAGAVDPELDPPRVAAWIMAMVGGVYLGAATSGAPDVPEQIGMLRLTVYRLLRPRAG